MFRGERWRRPESTPGAFNTFNLSFGPVLGWAEIAPLFSHTIVQIPVEKHKYMANI